MSHADDLPGLPADATVGVAVAAPGRMVQTFGQWSQGVAWSTIKIPLAVAALRNGIDAEHLVAETVVRSDNAAAEALWSLLGEQRTARVQAVLDAADSAGTRVESRTVRAPYTPFGQTRWALSDQARFAAHLSGIDHASPVITLMTQLCVDHRWGLAAQGFAAKGGWGPGVDSGYLVRQFALLPAVSGTTGVALAAEVTDGGLDAGIAIIDMLADWVVERLPDLTGQ